MPDINLDMLASPNYANLIHGGSSATGTDELKAACVVIEVCRLVYTLSQV